jgi:hypothetical protein
MEIVFRGQIQVMSIAVAGQTAWTTMPAWTNAMEMHAPLRPWHSPVKCRS